MASVRQSDLRGSALAQALAALGEINGAGKAKRKPPAKRGESDLELIFRRQARAAGIAGGMVQEHQFCERGWRLDFAWPALKVALEIDGGVWNDGAHVRGASYQETCEKLNRALSEGWQVYRATNHMVEDGRALAVVEAALWRAMASCRPLVDNGQETSP